MNELDEIRKRKMEEIQKQSLQEQEQMNQQIAQLESIVKTLFTKDALQRYGNLKSAHPEKAVQLLVAVGQMVQKGNPRQIDDEQMKRMLIMLEPKKRQIKITRK